MNRSVFALLLGAYSTALMGFIWFLRSQLPLLTGEGSHPSIDTFDIFESSGVSAEDDEASF